MLFKAGTYYVGDLCYIISDEGWDKLLDDTDFFENDNMTYKGYPIWVHNTTYGDGTYKDNKGREYSVDAGIIGIIPIEATDLTSKGGQVITFPIDFTVDYKNGVFFIGNYIIDTKGEDEEEEEEEEEICRCCGRELSYCSCDYEDSEVDDYKYGENEED